jgi:hypothetical protein
MSFSNNVSCELTNGINASVTSITINAAVSPYNNPPSSGRLVLADSTYNPTKFEIITYTGLTDNTTTLILTGVTRGQEGTSGTAFDANDEVYMSITAADMDATLLDADIGVTVQAYNSTYLVDADIGVNVEAFDSSILKDADIGVNVEAFDSSILKDADIGVNVQAHSAVLDGTQQSFTTALKNKLDLVEASADVTDTVNVTAAGALMDTEVDADIKTLSLPASTTISATAKTLLDDASISAMRTTLGVDAAGTINYTLPFTDNSTNWNTAFGWGDHSGLYSLAAHNHTGTYQPLATVLTNTTASFLTADETKLDFITATQAVNLDTMETRIDALDQVVILMGTFSASGGVFPGGGTAQAGESWISTTAGTINGMAIGIDDRVIAVTDNAGTGTAANWHKQDNTDLVQSVAGQTGVVTLAKADVGLGNVTNTSDANKPVSTAQQTALNLKANLASPTFTGTVNAATITASGSVTGSNLAVTNWNTAFGWGDHSIAGYTGNQTAGTGLTGTTTLNVIGGTGITANANDISLTAAGAGAAVYGSTSNSTKIDQITLDAYGRVTAIATGATGSMSSFNVQSNTGTQVAVSSGEELNFINGTNTTATVTNQTNPTVRIDSVDTIYTHPSNATTNVNTSGAEVIDQLSTSAEGHVTVLSKRTMTLADLGYTGETNATADQTKADIDALNIDADLLDGLHGVDFDTVVAQLQTQSSSVARYKITLPFLANSGKMMKFTISQYSSYVQHTYEVSGYLYNSPNNWYLPVVKYTGGGTPDIVMGRDTNGYAYVSIAGGNYTGIIVHNVTAGYSMTAANRLAQWTITSDTYVSNAASVSLSSVWDTDSLTTTNKTNYDTAFGWGDHSVAGYTGNQAAGTGLTGTTTLSLDFDELGLGGTLVGTDHLIASNNGVENRQLISSIPLSIFNNDSGWTSTPAPSTTAYDVTSWNSNGDAASKNAIRDKIVTMDAAIALNTAKVTNSNQTAGVGLSGVNTLDLNFSELADMTADISGSTQFILQDSTTESRKAASEIKLSVFNNDAGWTTATGTVDTSGTPVANDFARFTDANTVAGRSYSEVKTDLSLGNVTNTSDANKPVSTAQQTALNLKANLASPTFTGGITVGSVSYPATDGTSGQALVTNGSGSISFGDVDALPSQTGNSGKYLSTNGTDPAWAAVPTTKNLDGGFSNSTYTSVQSVNGGSA